MIELGYPLEPDLALLNQYLSAASQSGRWSNGGPIVGELERIIAHDLECASAFATASGTTALTLALLACDLREGGEVITSPLTFVATVQAIEAAGLVPVFAGVDPETLNLHPNAVRQAISSRTVAVLPIHLMGVAADAALDDVAREAGLPVVYDAAHAYGLPGITSRGVACAFSLHATKLLHTGEGGVVTCNTAEFSDRLRQVRNFGLSGEQPLYRGLNGKMSELNAAMGLAVHQKLAREIELRTALRAQYSNILRHSRRARTHALEYPRALVFEGIRCDPADQEQLLKDLAAASIKGRKFNSLATQNQRYASVPLIGATPEEIDQLASTLIALPLHGNVPPQALSSIAEVLQSSASFFEESRA